MRSFRRVFRRSKPTEIHERGKPGAPRNDEPHFIISGVTSKPEYVKGSARLVAAPPLDSPRVLHSWINMSFLNCMKLPCNANKTKKNAQGLDRQVGSRCPYLSVYENMSLPESLRRTGTLSRP